MKKVITIEQIKKYNEMVGASIGTEAMKKLALPMEYKEDDSKRWIKNPYCYLYAISDCFAGNGAEYYIKTIRGSVYLYMDLDGDPVDRYCLDDREIARLFFGV